MSHVAAQYVAFDAFDRSWRLTGEAICGAPIVFSSADVAVVGWWGGDQILASCVRGSGELAWTKAKARLTSSEREQGLVPAEKPRYVWSDGEISVLVLICAEILYPADYWDVGDVDLILHQVGFGMYSKHQQRAWRALQEAVALHFRAPLVCCVGQNEGEHPLTGVVDPLGMDVVSGFVVKSIFGGYAPGR